MFDINNRVFTIVCGMCHNPRRRLRLLPPDKTKAVDYRYVPGRFCDRCDRGGKVLA